MVVHALLTGQFAVLHTDPVGVGVVVSDASRTSTVGTDYALVGAAHTCPIQQLISVSTGSTLGDVRRRTLSTRGDTKPATATGESETLLAGTAARVGAGEAVSGTVDALRSIEVLLTPTLDTRSGQANAGVTGTVTLLTVGAGGAPIDNEGPVVAGEADSWGAGRAGLAVGGAGHADGSG